MRIGLAEDHVLFREVLRKICSELGHQIVCEADTGPDAIASVFRCKPDLVFLDVELPGCDGYDVLDQIKVVKPSPRVVFLTGRCDEYSVLRTQHAMVRGFLEKTSAKVSTLRECIEIVVEGGFYFSETYRLLKSGRQTDRRWSSEILTEREKEVLALIGGLMDDYEIGSRLAISSETAEKHRFNIQRKLEIGTRMELIRYARELGFMPKALSE